jgi:hypothetical protein
MTRQATRVTRHASLVTPRLFTFCLCLCALLLPGPAGAGVQPDRPLTRALEEEVRLAGRPQLYLVVDLAGRSLSIKSQGMELKRFPVESWSVSTETGLNRRFILRARPALPRPMLSPGQDPTLQPIELRHMPVRYHLVFDPDLVVLVSPSFDAHPLSWMLAVLHGGYARARGLLSAGSSPGQGSTRVQLRLVLSDEAAQSLAWSVIDGMPLLIKTS